MNTIHDIFMEELAKAIEESSEELSEEQVTEIINSITPEQAEKIKRNLDSSSAEMLKERRELSNSFKERNIKRWESAFDLFEVFIVICTECGDNINRSLREQAAKDGDILFNILIRHHARACHIAQEILCLLKNGFSDAAQARWRALHEVTVTAMFISKHGLECAERFYFHDVVDSYDAMLELNKFEHRLQVSGFKSEKLAKTKKDYEILLEKYGKSFRGHYGWASYLFSNNERIGFKSIEKSVELDHLRPYYKWASQNIHAGSKGMKNRLGTAESSEDILLVGQSDAGMADPALATAISLQQITTTLLLLEPTVDHIILMNILVQYQDQLGNEFQKVTKQKTQN